MKFTLPSLPYSYDALEPYIDAQTMELHYTKHHQAYIDKLNAALENHSDLKLKSIESILVDLSSLPEDIRMNVRNNGGGHFNHSFFWKLMKKNGGGEPNGLIGAEIKKTFGSFGAFQNIFNEKAKSVFGSGWAWLSVGKDGKLAVTALPNQDCPLSTGSVPMMGLDVWEHAYYLKYQNKRVDYIAAWWQVIDWDMVEEHYRVLVE